MNGMIRRIRRDTYPDWHTQVLAREWLVTNGSGGYASGTVSGLATRRPISESTIPWPNIFLLCLTAKAVFSRVRIRLAQESNV